MEDFAVDTPESAGASELDLVVSLDGFDGPIDLLLTLAREQKLDLSRISILALAEQYLAFIAQARKLRLEIAADYLVMAAWLAFLKSRLLLPVVAADEPNPADMADALKFQLKRLEAMQEASGQLQALPQLDREIFMRGVPERIEVIEKPVYYLPIYDLLKALGEPQRRKKAPSYNVPLDKLMSIETALERLRNTLGYAPSWASLSDFIPDMLSDPLESRSAVASTFAATLEMVKNGELIIRQDGTFGPIFVKRAVQTNEQTVEQTV